MSTALSEAIADLRVAARLDEPGCAERVDGAVNRVYALQDPDAIGPMLLVLDDRHTFQELMWSIVHAAESFDAKTYVPRMVAVLPKLETSAGEWAVTLVGRVLNDDPSRACLAGQIAGDDPDRPDVRKTVFAILDRLVEDAPDRFAEKAAQVRGRSVGP